MSDIQDPIKLIVKEYQVATPQFDVPDDSPNWVKHVFPALLHSIYNGFNSVLEKLMCGFNDSFSHMQSQIDNLTKTLKDHADQIASLKDSLQQKQYDTEEQNSLITKLKFTMDTNETSG